jgi:hypothetical protein
MDKEYKRNYTNFFLRQVSPSSIKSNSNLRVTYQGSTRQPTLDQLQPLRNNQDFFLIKLLVIQI